MVDKFYTQKQTMEWDLLQNLKTQKETELHCINQIIDNYQTVNLKFPVAAFGLFDQRLLHSCEAGIQPALITENSKPWMLLMKNLPISSLPVRLAGQAPTAASLLAVFVMGTPTKAETPKEEDSSGPCRYDHFWVKSQ
jgi:hypothetical protein